VDFDDQLEIEIIDGQGRVRLPSRVVPLNHGGKNGWYEVKGLQVGNDAIDGKVPINFTNAPRLHISRISGAVTIEGRDGSFSGRCQAYDPEKVQHAFWAIPVDIGEACKQLVDSSDLVSAIVGGILGALAGGVPAWLLARRQSDETLRRDQEQRVRAEKALAFSVSVKLITIINSTINLTNHVKTCMALREMPGNSQMQPWQVLIPMIGFSDEGSVRFTPEEMAVFAAAQEPTFMQDMMLLANRHAASIAAFLEYCSMRRQFAEIGPKPESFNGPIGTMMVTLAEMEQYKAYTIPLNDVALGLDSGLDEDVRLARRVAQEFGKVTARYFKLDKFINISFPSEAELAAKRIARYPTAMSAQGL